MSENIFKEVGEEYLEKGISVIPDKYMSKAAGVKDYSKYSFQLPSKEEFDSWSKMSKSNIAIMLGETSGLVALDIDEVRPEILEIIMPMLPKSPVVKVGAKGETRFFRYTGVEHNQGLKFGGEMVVEVISNNKKTTIPPSIHPSGATYKWVGDKTLLDIDKNKLPMIPPSLFAAIEQKLLLKFPDMDKGVGGKLHSGRNDALVSLSAKLIKEQKPLDVAITELIKRDAELHDPPLFTDANEYYHTEPRTNALMLYSNVLESVNRKRFRDSKEYEVPMVTAISEEKVLELREEKMGKSVSKEKLKNPSLPLPHAQGVMGKLQSNILECSWIKQPNFAFSASLAMMAVVISRKVTFQGMAPNLYLMNIAPSGSGKDAPQKKVQEWLIACRSTSLLGSGDYVSDASLMDTLDIQPVRLDIMDECGGILRVVNDGKSEYNSKMADVLAELYTSSNSMYLGRATAGGVRGSCYRPNVNILGSTTPTGFSEGVSLKAIEKGLLGRFLIFFGSSDQPAERLKSIPNLDSDTINKLKWWITYEAEETDREIGGIPQRCTELKADRNANKELDTVFEEFDTLRRNTKHDNPILPIVARLYQQMVKLVIIHACSRTEFEVPTINVDDVRFGYETIMCYYQTIQQVIDKYIFSSKDEKNKLKVLNTVKARGASTLRDIYDATRDITKRERDNILEELIELRFIDRIAVQEEVDGQLVHKIYYKFLEDLNNDKNASEKRRSDNDGISRSLTETTTSGST